MMFVARELVNRDLDSIWELNELNTVKVQFEDKEVEATGRSIIYSWFFWEYHREFPEISILEEHLVEQKHFTDSTHPKFLESIIWSVYELSNNSIEIKKLREIAYEITNEIFNKLSYNLEDYVTSSCIFDYLEIMEDETINEWVEETPLNGNALVETKDKIKTRLRRPDIYQENGLKKICQADLVNWDQLLQAVGFRGYTTDTDNYFFPSPIMKGYAHGITKLQESLQESTSSIKSLIAQDDSLRQTEFFNKRMQLLVQSIIGLVSGNCGSTEYNRIRVTGNGSNGKGVFNSLVGKFYLDKESQTLKAIKLSDMHLIGQRLQIRSVMNCRYRHTGYICETCYGELSLNVPRECNLGYFSAVAFCEIISQSVLSTKHSDNAATVDTIYLEPAIEQIFDIRRREQELYLKRVYKEPHKVVSLIVSPSYNGDKSQLNYLEDLELIDEITNDTVMQKSNIRAFKISIEDINNGTFIVAPMTLTLGDGVDGAYLSKDLLEYIKEHDWSITDKGDYEFDLEHFDKTKPILSLPKKHMNMLQFKNIVSKFMESSGNSKHRTGERLTEYNRVENKTEQAINRFLELVNEKVTVNITHLEIFITIFMGNSVDKSDARIPKYGEPFEFITASSAFNLRSMGAVMPFKDQFPWMTRVESFDGSVKIGSPYDGVMAPEIFNR